MDKSLFHRNNRKWDWKMIDAELKGIVFYMTFRDQKEHSQLIIRNFLMQFLLPFESCDLDFDNVLNITEFRWCITNYTFLSKITPPSAVDASFVNYTFTNETGYLGIPFNTYDNDKNGYINFSEYMLLRLFIFSLRKCSVLAPFIEEVSFECAVSSGFRTISRTTVRKIFYLSLDLSNSDSSNLDFITFSIIAHSIRLYSKINFKEDSDATIREFERALDSNQLPHRYSNEIVRSV